MIWQLAYITAVWALPAVLASAGLCYVIYQRFGCCLSSIPGPFLAVDVEEGDGGLAADVDDVRDRQRQRRRVPLQHVVEAPLRIGDAVVPPFGPSPGRASAAGTCPSVPNHPPPPPKWGGWVGGGDNPGRITRGDHPTLTLSS